MSRLFNHFNNLLPGTSGDSQSQVASAFYVVTFVSDEFDVSEFTGAWWDSLEDETKVGLLCIVATGVLKEAVKSFRPEEAAIVTLRAALSLSPEDRRDIDA